jgi:hypothetical protein
VAGPFDWPQLDGGYEISVKRKNCALDRESKQQGLNRVFQIAFFSECKEGSSGTLGEAEGLVSNAADFSVETGLHKRQFYGRFYGHRPIALSK